MAEGTGRVQPVQLREIAGFKVLEKIGQGGMGAVFKARQVSLDRIVALKVLPPSVARDAEYLERFQREARASARLNHPHIVQGIDVGCDPATGLWYFAMEYVDGQSLRQILDQHGPLLERRALEIVRDVALALDCAARHGIVHRDVKPDNILIARTGETKLADLGLAKRADEEAGVTIFGKTVGTPHYMAPEQVQGLAAEIDVRSDLYALGATLFHLVTGRTPFEGPTSAAVMVKHVSARPPVARQVAPQVSEACSHLIQRLMQKSRQQRFQTPGELVAHVERMLAGVPTPARAAARVTTGPRASVETRTDEGAVRPAPAELRAGVLPLVIGGLALLLLGGALGVWVASRGGPAQVAEKRAAGRKPEAGGTTPAGGPLFPPTAGSRPSAAAVPVPAQPEAKASAPAPKPGPPEVKAPPPKSEPPQAQAAPGKAALPQKVDQIARPPPAESPAPPVKTEAPAATNTGFRAEYFEGLVFAGSRKTGVDAELDFQYRSGAPPGLELRAGVSARWTGLVAAPATGTYVFEAQVDEGGRLFLDHCLLLDLWAGRPPQGRSLPITLEQGKKYLLTFEWRNRQPRGGARVRWGPLDGPLTVVRGELPEGGEAPLGQLHGGWVAEYFLEDAARPALSRREWALMHDWRQFAPAPELPADRFRAIWRGLVVPPETAEYTFNLDADEGARLFVNEVLVLDAYNGPAAKFSTPPLKLEQGRRYPVRVEYVERSYEACCRLTWSAPEMRECPAPAEGEGEPDAPPSTECFLAEYGVLDNPKPLLSRRELYAGWNWRNGSPARELPNDNFWAVYTGWIQPPADGEYTFSMDHEGGVMLSVDDCLLLDRRSRHAQGISEVSLPLAGGKCYFLRLEFRTRSYAAHLRLNWRSQEMAERAVAALAPLAVRAGSKEAGRVETAVLAEYGAGGAKGPLLRRLETRICHDWGGGSPAPTIGDQNFWGRWTGGLKVKESGNHLFRLESENGQAELKLQGVSLVRMGGKAPKSESQPLPLQRGTIYVLELSYAHRGYDALLKLLWKPPGAKEFEVVPPEAFVLSVEGRNLPRQVPK